jgi:glucose-6-phosphate isomerase
MRSTPYFQWLHQGSPLAACDFILVGCSSCGLEQHQDLAIANSLAQVEALAVGRDAAVDEPHRAYAGDRPSSVIAFDVLTPFRLGSLLAMYEHKVFVQSLVWGVNAFDQWGVELGNKFARALCRPRVATAERRRSRHGSVAC